MSNRPSAERMFSPCRRLPLAVPAPALSSTMPPLPSGQAMSSRWRRAPVQGLEGGLAFLELEAGNGRAHVALGRDVHPEGAGQSLGQLEHGAVEPLPGAVDGSAVHQIGAPVASGDADAVRRGGE